MARAVREQDLLLFRAVDAPQRRAIVLQMLEALDAGITSRASHLGARCDAWELSDAAGSADEPPVAVATTRLHDDGHTIELTAIAVTPSRRREGIGRRLIHDLSDALRARGAMLLVAGPTADEQCAAIVLQRCGFRRTSRDPADDRPSVASATYAVEL